jgi:hypothetical protein
MTAAVYNPVGGCIKGLILRFLDRDTILTPTRRPAYAGWLAPWRSHNSTIISNLQCYFFRSTASLNRSMLWCLCTLQVSTFGDAKKQSNRKPRPAADDGPSGSRQPQASATASTRWTSTAPARSRTETSQPSPRPPDGAAVAAGRTWRAPSRRHSFHHRFDSTGRPGGAGGLWTAATTLGVIVLFGRVTAVVFLCSCLYGARFVRARAAGAMAKASSGGTGSSRRFGAVGVAAEKAVVEPRAAEEFKKKVVMAGLLDRAGQAPSSRFGR